MYFAALHAQASQRGDEIRQYTKQMVKYAAHPQSTFYAIKITRTSNFNIINFSTLKKI